MFSLLTTRKWQKFYLDYVQIIDFTQKIPNDLMPASSPPGLGFVQRAVTVYRGAPSLIFHRGDHLRGLQPEKSLETTPEITIQNKLAAVQNILG
jgi:hypothetical protein